MPETAADISEQALAVARKNADKNNVQVEFVHSDMFEAVGTFDMIVCNPPYITASEMQALPAEVKREPYTALYGGEDGLDFYRRISSEYASHLSKGGVLVLEIGSSQADAIRGLFADRQCEVITDTEGRDRGLIIRELTKDDTAETSSIEDTITDGTEN